MIKEQTNLIRRIAAKLDRLTTMAMLMLRTDKLSFNKCKGNVSWDY